MLKLPAILSVIFLFTGIFSPIWQGQKLNQHRKEIKKQIRNQNIKLDNIDTLFFANLQTHDITVESEIEVNGMMYDVLEVIPISDGIQVVAFRDIKEKQLLQSLSNKINNEIPWSQSPNFKVQNPLFSEHFNPINFGVIPLNKIHFCDVISPCHCGFVGVRTHPPEILFS